MARDNQVVPDKRWIYLQLLEQIRRVIVRGGINPGEKIMTVRQMAETIGVNRNTVARVYAELEKEGLIECRGARGTLIAADGAHIKIVKRDLFRQYAERFGKEIKELDISLEEAVKLLKEVMKELEEKHIEEMKVDYNDDNDWE